MVGAVSDRCDSGQGRLCEKTSLLWTLTPDKVSLFSFALLTPNKVSLSCLFLSLSLSLSLSAKSRKTGLSSAMHVHLHTRVCRDICMTVYVQLCTSKTNILSLTKVVKGAHFPFTVECLEILGRVPKFWTFSSVQFCAATSQLTFTGTVRVGFKFGLLLTSAFVHMYVY